MSIGTHSVEGVISYIVAADCRMKLAVERYNKDFKADITQEEMLALVMNDPSGLFGQLKVSLAMKLYDQLMQTQISLGASLADMKPAEIARLYVGQATAFSSLTSKQIEDAPEAPTDFITAKRNLISRVENYKKRKLGIEETDESETG